MDVSFCRALTQLYRSSMNRLPRLLLSGLKEYGRAFSVFFCIIMGVFMLLEGLTSNARVSRDNNLGELALFIQTLALGLLYCSTCVQQRRHQRRLEHVALLNHDIGAQNSRLRSLINAASQIAVITTDAKGRTLLFSTGAESVFGFSREEIMGRHWLEILRARKTAVASDFNQPLMDCSNALTDRFAEQDTRLDVATQWRFHRKDGSNFIGELRCAENIDVDTGQVEHINIIIDISERVALQTKINEGQTFLKLLTQNIPNVLYQYHLREAGESYFSYCSPSLKQVFELSPEDVVGVRFSENPLFSRVHRDDLALIHAVTAESIETRKPWACDFRVTLPMAGTRWLRGDAYAKKQTDGTHVWYGSFIDITELKDRESALRVQAITDELTGIYNRRYFMDSLTKQIELARRYSHPFSLIMLDLDHFKLINDRWGHETGDRVLKESCDLIASRLRISDVFCRVGGEEFAILCPDTHVAQAANLAESLRYSLANHVITPDEQVTASFGVACWDESLDGQALLRQADQATYSAKKEGRNRVSMASL